MMDPTIRPNKLPHQTYHCIHGLSAIIRNNTNSKLHVNYQFFNASIRNIALFFDMYES